MKTVKEVGSPLIIVLVSSKRLNGRIIKPPACHNMPHTYRFFISIINSLVLLALRLLECVTCEPFSELAPPLLLPT